MAEMRKLVSYCELIRERERMSVLFGYVKTGEVLHLIKLKKYFAV